MLTRFVSTTILATLLGAAVSTGCTVSTDNGDNTDASLTIDNEESFSITDIYIDPSGFSTDDNLLSGGTLDPGSSITVSVSCDTYDVEIIDETGTDCYISDYNLCGTDDEWTLDNTFFDGCASTEPRTMTPTTSPKSSKPATFHVSRK